MGEQQGPSLGRKSWMPLSNWDLLSPCSTAVASTGLELKTLLSLAPSFFCPGCSFHPESLPTPRHSFSRLRAGITAAGKLSLAPPSADFVSPHSEPPSGIVVQPPLVPDSVLKKLREKALDKNQMVSLPCPQSLSAPINLNKVQALSHPVALRSALPCLSQTPSLISHYKPVPWFLPLSLCTYCPLRREGSSATS